MARCRSIPAALLGLALASQAHAADLEHSRKLVRMIYDIGLYGTELDRLVDQPVRIGAAGPAPERGTVRTLMLAQREAVLAATVDKVAARASDTQVDALLDLAVRAGPSPDPAVVDAAVAVVKASFTEALRDQLARTMRGAAEFPCTKDQRSHCPRR